MLPQEKLEELYDSLTLEEKVGQLLQLNHIYFGVDGLLTGEALKWQFREEDVVHAGSVLNIFGRERLETLQREHLKNNKTPMIFMADVTSGYDIAYPFSLAQACSFDTKLVKALAGAAADAATADGINVTFSPMVDISRDARWGRCQESYGEDVFLSCQMTKAVVEGYQGERSDALSSLSACVKHFAAYGGAEGGRDYNNVELSRRALLETYLPPYKAAVEAGCDMVMTSFNTIGGVPATIDKQLVNDVLRGQWGFDGCVISDYAGILQCTCHRAVDNEKELAQLSVEAGVDIDMMDYIYTKYIPKLLAEGTLKEETFRDRVMNVLRLKNKKGLLEDPYRYLKGRAVDSEATYALAVKMVEESCVLLKNDEMLLPVRKEKRIALIGPYAVKEQAGTMWNMLSKKGQLFRKTPSEAFGELFEQPVMCEAGCAMLEYDNFLAEADRDTDPCYREPEKYQERAIEAARQAETVIMMLGEHGMQSGESASRAEITIPELQMKLLREIYEVNQNIVTVVFCGRPLDLREVSKRSKSVLIAWMPGDAGSEGIANLIAGRAVPTGKLSMSMPYCVGQCPVYYAMYPTGHGHAAPSKRFSSRYVDAPNAPLYPFGFGLSYTTFAYSDISADAEKLTQGGCIHFSATVTNTGDRDAEEVVQLYISDLSATGVSRPFRELKGFQRVLIRQSEAVEVVFEIKEEDLRFYNAQCQYESEAGEYIAYIGGDSRTENGVKFQL